MPNSRFASVLVVNLIALVLIPGSRVDAQEVRPNRTARDILGNPEFVAISFGGFRHVSQEHVPSVEDLKEDCRILSAMGIKFLRTYKTQKNAHAANLLEAIKQLREADPQFEMYVMLGAWIDCEGAFTDSPNHEAEDKSENTAEIETAVKLANQYPEIVKVIAVGNEAMVHWAASYFVRPRVILGWVRHLQELKKSGKLSADLWITSSDNFASWGGEGAVYQTEDLKALIRAVDYVSLHTYPFHDSHYNSDYWRSRSDEAKLSRQQKADRAVDRAVEYARLQFQTTAKFIHSVDSDKPIHIGETGWASKDNRLYGKTGSGAADPYKQKRYHDAMRDWTQRDGISCFYFEAFDEPWKDAENQDGSENHFGLFTVDGQAKFAVWDAVDAFGLSALRRGDSPIRKTYDGDSGKVISQLLDVMAAGYFIDSINDERQVGQPVTESVYLVYCDDKEVAAHPDASRPSARVKLNVWDGTCEAELLDGHVIRVATGEGKDGWWGFGLEMQADGKGENLSRFSKGRLHFDIKGPAKTSFAIGFQTGQYNAGTQTNNFAQFKDSESYQLREAWTSYAVELEEIDQKADLTDVTSLLYLRGDAGLGDSAIEIKNVYFSK